MFSHLPLLVALAGLSSAQTPPSCSTFAQGYLAVRPASNSESGTPTIYLGTIPGVNSSANTGAATGDAKQSGPLLVSQYKNGSALGTPHQLWEFASCSDLSSHPYPPGYSPPTSGPTNDYFGIIRPAGDAERCFSLTSKKDNSTGAKNALVNVPHCTDVDQRYRTFMIEDYIYGDSDYGMRLFYADADDTGILADTPHKEFLFVTNDKSAGSAAQQLLLLPNSN